jgi:hypothetical protein
VPAWNAACGKVVCCLLVLAFFSSGLASAEIPKRINYQGRLTDRSTGEPLVGSHDLTFRIYDQAVGGDILWSESGTATTDAAGVFSVVLGSTNPIEISFGGPCWLEIDVGGETLTPRREIVSVPYAYHAMNSDSLGGLACDSYALAGHLHDDLYVNEGQANSITGAMIVDGEVTDEDISADAAIDPSKVAGTAWTSANDGAGSGLDADLLDGQHADAFAPAVHQHDDRYYTETELNSSGSINQAGNPVDWTKLKGVPAGFADGTDNGAGDGYSLDAADGSPTDVVYVANDGNVGIGLTNPTLGKLQVLATDATGVYASSVNGTGILGFSQNDNGVTGVSNNGKAGAFVGDVYVSGLVDTHTGFSVDEEPLLRVWDLGTLLVGRHIEGTWEGGRSTCVGESTAFEWLGDWNTLVGYNAGHGWPRSYGDKSALTSESNQRNVFVGAFAGYKNASSHNVYVGFDAGRLCKEGAFNTFLGEGAGRKMATGQDNVLLGCESGQSSTAGQGNVFCGAWAGSSRLGGQHNTYLGNDAGGANYAGLGTTGDENTAVGAEAGMNCSGSGNVFLGYQAGYGHDGDDKLWIANGEEPENVLIYGNFATHHIGFGRTDPTHCLDIESPWPSDWITLSSSASNSILGLELANDARTWEVDVRGDKSDIFSIMDVNAADAIRLAIDTSGRIGIGTYAPERLMHLKGAGPRILIEAESGSPELNLKTAGDAVGDVWAIYKHGTEKDLRIYQNGDKVTFENGTGNVAIGTTDPAGYKLYVNGTAYATGGWQPSDVRLKTDLRAIDDALGKVMCLNGVSFRWRTEEYGDRGFPPGRHYGLVAQEVEEVLPEVVGSGPNDEKALAYSELIPVLVESIKQLKSENDDLRARIEALEGR